MLHIVQQRFRTTTLCNVDVKLPVRCVKLHWVAVPYHLTEAKRGWRYWGGSVTVPVTGKYSLLCAHHCFMVVLHKPHLKTRRTNTTWPISLWDILFDCSLWSCLLCCYTVLHPYHAIYTVLFMYCAMQWRPIAHYCTKCRPYPKIGFM